MFLLFSVTAYAANPVIPKTSFEYRGMDIEPSVKSIYRTDHAYFKDEADILTEKSEKELWEKLQATVDYLNVNIAFFVGGNYRTDDETVTFTQKATESIFGSNSDSIFIYLDFEGYSPAYDYIRTLNKADEIFSETKRNKILNVMYQNLPKSTEPVYEDAVRTAISNGLDEIKSQGYVNSINSKSEYSSTNPEYDNAAAPDNNAAPPHEYNGHDSGNRELSEEIPLPVIIGAIVLIVVLIIISSIAKAIKRLFRGSSGGSYYNNYDDYYGHHNSYHDYGSHHHHHHHHHDPYHGGPPRHRPPRDHSHTRSSRPSHSSSPSRNSSNNNPPRSSGSGHYR